MHAIIAVIVLLVNIIDLSAEAAPQGRVAAISTPGSVWDEQWKEFEANATAAGFELEYFVNAQLGGEEAMLTALRRNRVQVGGFSLEGLSSTVPELTAVMAPYLFTEKEEVDYVYDNYLTPVLEPLFEAQDLVFLSWVEVGWAGLVAKRPVMEPVALDGLKIRGAPNAAHQSILQTLEADSLAMPATEFVTALQSGLADGGIMGLIPYFVRYRDFADHYMDARFIFDTGAIVANKRWFDRLTPEEQAVLKTFYPPAGRARAEVRAVIAGIEQGLKAEGKTIHRMSAEQLAQWQTATEPARQMIVDEIGGAAPQVLEAALEGQRAWRAKNP